MWKIKKSTTSLSLHLNSHLVRFLKSKYKRLIRMQARALVIEVKLILRIWWTSGVAIRADWRRSEALHYSKIPKMSKTQ